MQATFIFVGFASSNLHPFFTFSFVFFFVYFASYHLFLFIYSLLSSHQSFFIHLCSFTRAFICPFFCHNSFLFIIPDFLFITVSTYFSYSPYWFFILSSFDPRFLFLNKSPRICVSFLIIQLYLYFNTFYSILLFPFIFMFVLHLFFYIYIHFSLPFFFHITAIFDAFSENLFHI